MTPADAAQLLTLAATFDKRKIGRAESVAWADALAGLAPADCAEAIRAHFRETDAYLMPIHVRRGVEAIRARRLEVNYEDVPELEAVADDPVEYQRVLRAYRDRIANGWTPTTSPKPNVRIAAAVKELAERTADQLPRIPRMSLGTHPSSLTPPADLSPADPTRKGTR